MNEEAIQTMYELAQQNGYGKGYDDFVTLLNTNEDAFSTMYGLAQDNGYQKPVEDFYTLMGVKKKEDAAVLESPVEEVSMESTLPTGTEAPAQSGDTASLDTQVGEPVAPQPDVALAQEIAPEPLEPKGFKTVFKPGGMGLQYVQQDEANYLTGSLGDAVNTIPYFGELIDDTFRSLDKGLSKRESVNTTHELLNKGSNFNMEDVSSYVTSVREYDEKVERLGKSSSMQSFESIYAEDPNPWGVVKGFAANLDVIPEVFLESASALLNKSSAEAFLATEIAGTAGGAAATGGLGAPAAAAATLPFAFAAAGAQVEIAATFTELLKEEVGEREFNEESVFAVLNDKEAYARIRRKSKIKGYAVGAIDAFGAKVGVGVYTKLAKKGKKVGAVLGTAGVESSFAGAGEAVSSRAIGREASAADIGMEMAAGQMGTPVDVISARGQMRSELNQPPAPIRPAKNPVGMDAPSYKINGEELDLETFTSIVDGLSSKELMDLGVEVSNDDATSSRIDAKFKRAQVEVDVDPEIQGEDRERLIALELERKKFEDSTLRSAKRKISQIDAKIESIQNKYDVDPEIPQAARVTPTFSEVLDGQATMQDGRKGFIRRDKEFGDRLVFETENQIIDLGNANELMDKPVSSLNIEAEVSSVQVTPEGEFVVEGEVYGSQSELPTLGIEYNQDGSVKAVSVKSSNGKATMFEGTVAEDLAYQILLENAQSESQVERVNNELDNDQEFQREHDKYVERKNKELAGETEGATEVNTDEVPTEVSPEPEPAPDPLEPIEAEPVLTREELAKRQKEDDLFQSDPKGINIPLGKGESVRIGSLKKLGEVVRRGLFSSRAFKTRSLRGLMEGQEGGMSYYNNAIARGARRSNKAMKAATKGLSKEETAAMNEAFDARLRGDMTQALPQELEILAAEMRANVDGLTREIIALGGIPESTVEVMQENLGSYLKNSYRIFDDPNWSPSEAVVDRAKAVVREQVRVAAETLSARTGEDVNVIMERMVDSKLADITGSLQGSSAFNRGSKFGSKDTGVLKKRKNIDPAIQEYMGLYTDPTLNWARTMQNLGALATNTKFLNDVHEMGVKNGWMFEQNDPNRDSRFSYKMAGENTETLNPLGGMYTTPEIGATLEAAQQQFGVLQKAYRTAVASAKWSKTIASPVTHSVNLFGNIGFAWSNGHFDMSGPSPFKVLGANIDALNDVELQGYFDEMVKLGVIGQSPSLSEVRALFKDGNVEALLESRASASNITKRQKIANGVSKAKSGAESVYQMEDDVWKIFGFNNESSRYADAMYGKKVNELTPSEREIVFEKSAENVKNTYANYSRAPQSVQKLRFLPIGNFVTFQAEAYRTQFNIFALAKAEISEGKRTNNPKLTQIGKNRMAGAVSYNLFRRSIVEGSAVMAGVGLTGALSGLSTEQEQTKKSDIQKFLPPWSTNSDVYYLDISPGNVQYIDANASDPFGNTSRIVNAFMNGDDLGESLANSLAEAVGPFADPEMVANTLNNVLNNKKSSGAPLTTPGMTDVDKGLAYANEFYDLFKPGLFNSVKTFRQSENKVRDGLLMMVGNRPYSVDINKQFGYKSYDLSRTIRDAEKEGNTDLYNESIKEMSELYMAAIRLGVPSKDLVENMKGITKDNRYKIRTGKYVR